MKNWKILKNFRIIQSCKDKSLGLDNGNEVLPFGTKPDLSQNDPNAADYVKNRTHYEETVIVNEPLNITWDGNTEGLVMTEGVPAYKVSDSVLTDEQIKLTTETDNDGRSTNISNKWDKLVQNGSVSEAVVITYGVAYVRTAGVEFLGSVFPETGIYFMLYDGAYIASLTTTEPVEHTKTVVKKIDKKFLPIDAHQTVFYYSSPDHRLYHDRSLTLGVSMDDLKMIINYRPIMLSDRHGDNLYYPTKIGFLGSYAIAYVRGVSAEDEIRMYTSEYGGGGVE